MEIPEHAKLEDYPALEGEFENHTYLEGEPIISKNKDKTKKRYEIVDLKALRKHEKNKV